MSRIISTPSQQRLSAGGRRRIGVPGLCVIVAILALTTGGTARAASCTEPMAAAAGLAGDLRATLDLGALRHLYEAGSCLWSEGDADTLLAVLGRAGREGLDAGDYHVADLADRAGQDSRQRDILLSDAALRYARDMRDGRVGLESLAEDIDFRRPSIDPVAGLGDALRRHALGDWLASLAPSQPEYARLVGAFGRYRRLAAEGGWAVLPMPARSVRPGQTSPIVPALRRRLAAEGDVAETGTDAEAGGDRLDGDLVRGLRHFQSRHGLDADGILGKKTIAALNVSASARANQIAMNLERWRMLSSGIEPTRIEVNAAAATATLYIGGTPQLAMRAVVGKAKTQTPILRSAIRAVIVNPPWVVPASIIRKEILPTLKRNPDYLEEHDMYWRGDQIVQRPGEENSLGRLKFELSSSFDVYLHDTPARGLFARDERARSHGCVRLEKPLDLAERLLKGDPEWSRERIEQAIAEGETQRIATPEAVQVVIVYWTAFVDADGSVEFRNDIYGRDSRLMAALEQRKPRPYVTSALAGKGCGESS